MLFWLETKKIVTSTAVIGFLLLCLIFNVFLITTGSRDDYTEYIAKTSETTGYVIDGEFRVRLTGLEPDEFKDALLADTEGMTDVFDGYDTAYIGEAYIKGYGLNGGVADAMREKYAKLQEAVDTKAVSDESLTLYFAGRTHDKHMELFGLILKILLMEGSLAAALIMFLSVGYEYAGNTALVVYASKIGRKILRHKLMASVTTGFIAYALLTGATLTLYFSLNSYGGTWDSNISSGFNYIVDYLAGNRPFVTWQSFTVFTYLLALLSVSALLTQCFALMAFMIGTWVKNSYIGFLIFIAANAVMMTARLCIPPSSIFSSYISLTPACLLMWQSIWFTDGASITLWANFETLGACASMVLLTSLAVFSVIRFRKRDIV